MCKCRQCLKCHRSSILNNMAKKTDEKEEIKEEAQVLNEVAADFGRADLNLLRDTLNELVRRAN